MFEQLEKLKNLYNSKNIPNIILYGDNLSCKKTILENFLNYIYKTDEEKNKYCLIINCAHGKGNIKYIRENLKLFANYVIEQNSLLFKSIVLLNADKLTMDAQSVLRRCIEIYNQNTRFFIIVDDKTKLIKPILSRFSDIFCHCNYKYLKLKKILDNENSNTEIINLVNNLYNRGYTANLIINYIELNIPNNLEKYKFLLYFDKYKREIRNEKLLIFIALNYLVFRFNLDIENINII
jgi:DNA polymerase III delta prime subunit